MVDMSVSVTPPSDKMSVMRRRVHACLLCRGIERALERSPWALPICRLPRMKLTVIAADGKKDYDGKCEVERGGC